MTMTVVVGLLCFSIGVFLNHCFVSYRIAERDLGWRLAWDEGMREANQVGWQQCCEYYGIDAERRLLGPEGSR